jgi:hypothetical protein
MSDSHNQRTAEFIQTILRDALKDGGGYPEIMVIVESLLLGVMLVNVKHFGMNPHVSVEMVESAVQRATERFTEQVLP